MGGGGGLSLTNKNIAPPNEIKPISPFGLGLMFLLDLSPKNKWVNTN